MVKNTKRQKKFILAFIIIFICVCGTRLANAIWDFSSAVQVDLSSIEDSTLIIGTHLIHLSAMTDELYQIAYQSATDSIQTNMYYKSELADGAWIDLGSASSVFDLTNVGNKAASDQELNELYFEYHTKSDYITYDLRTNESVCIFDINNPYDIEALEELDPLKNHYEMINEQSSKSFLRDKILLFFQTEIEDDSTIEFDNQIEALNRYLKVLIENNGGSAQIEVVNKVMSKIDSARRAYIMEKLSQMLDELSDDISKEESEISDTLTSIYSSENNVEESLIEHSANMLNEGNGILTKAEFEESNALIQNATDEIDSECDINVDNLSVIYNVNRGEIVNRIYERNYLVDNIAKRSETEFINTLSKGVSDEYLTQERNQSSRVVLNTILDKNISSIASIKSELEYIIEAILERMDYTEGIKLLQEKINDTSQFKTGVPNDAFREGAYAEADDYKEWLINKLSMLNSKNGGNQNELTKLYEEKLNLQQEKLEALDHNNLDEANKIDSLINANDEKIQELEKKLEDEISNLSNQIKDLKNQLDTLGDDDESLKNNLNNQIAQLEGQLEIANSSSSDATQISAIKEFEKLGIEAIDAYLNNTELLDNVSDALDSLEIFLDSNTKQVYEAIKNIYTSLVAKKYLNETKDFDELIERIEKLIADKSDLIHGVLNSNQALESNEISNLITDLENALFEDGSVLEIEDLDISIMKEEDMESALLAGLAQYAEYAQSDEVNSMLAALAKDKLDNGNEQIFKTIESNAEVKYVSAKAVALMTGYRYLWNDSLKTSTLALGSKYYEFTAFSNKVVRNSELDSYDTLVYANEFKELVFIENDYVNKEFGCEGFDLGNTGYGVVVNENIMKLAANICDKLMQGFI